MKQDLRGPLNAGGINAAPTVSPERRVAYATPGTATTKDWLGPVRRAALERFRTLGYPTPKIEDWHFTSVAPIVEANFPTLEGASGQVHATDLEAFTFGESTGRWSQLVFVNGVYAPSLSATRGLPAGSSVTTLRAVLDDPTSPLRRVVERHLTRIAPYEDAAFTALNTGSFTDGALIHVPANTVLPGPLHLLFATDAEAARRTVHPRVLMVLDRHAEATVVESYVGVGDAPYVTNTVTEIVLGEGAQLSHYRVQRESARAYHVGTSQAHQSRDSRYRSFSFATGAALSRQNIYTSLDGPNGEAVLNGLYMVDGTQHVDHQTRIVHVAPQCASHEVYKGILDGGSRGVFNGKVYVCPEAQKTDGKQTNNNLLLSPDARVDTKPQLEIFADDVKCTHGATVGRLDAVALFYLKSRGIGAEQARTLLTYAFAADVLQSIGDDVVRTGLEALARERFVGVDPAAAAA